MFSIDCSSYDPDSLSRQFFESAAFSEFQAGVVLEPESPPPQSPDQENTVRDYREGTFYSAQSIA